MRWSTSLVAAVLSLFAFATEAATSVSGPITTDTVWSLAQSPFDVTSDVTVNSGATLTLEAGVAVRLGPGTNLIVNAGALRAIGTSAQPIVITSSADNGSGSPT